MLMKMLLSTEQTYKLYCKYGLCNTTYVDINLPIVVNRSIYVHNGKEWQQIRSKLNFDFKPLLDITYNYLANNSSTEFCRCMSLREDILIEIFNTQFVIAYRDNTNYVTILGENRNDTEKFLFLL